MEGDVQLAVTVEDDPGRDLGEDRQIGHRFFFSPDEVEPLGPREPEVAARRILVAGIGNVFLGDDGFGVAVAGRLAAATLPPGVDVVDFGIRGMDLAYALRDYDVAILVDAVPRGGAPGTLYVIEPELDADEAGPDAHGMDPVKVLALARGLGDPLPRVLVVGCEPAHGPERGRRPVGRAERAGPRRARRSRADGRVAARRPHVRATQREKGAHAMNKIDGRCCWRSCGMMAAAVAVQWPEIQRYLKVRQM